MRHVMTWGPAGLFAAALGVVACGSGGGNTAPEHGTEPEPTAGVSEEKSGLARLPPDASTADVSELVTDNTDFVFSLNGTLDATGNLIFSPESISTALAMLYPGAAGTTKSEMQTALHFAEPDAALAGAFNTLDQALASRASPSGTSVKLRVSNALWGQQGMQVLPSYLDVLAQNYGAGMNTVDFAMQAEAAREDINAWVSEQTEQKIPELLAEGQLDSTTRLLLTNAVYFKASWATQFVASSTTNQPFSALDGSSVSVPVMHGSFDLAYAEGAGFQAVEIPYAGLQLSFLAILPAAGTFASFRSGLAANVLAGIDASKMEAQVDVSLPRFEVRSSVPLRNNLVTLGMSTAFSNAADFSGIDGTRDLQLGFVQHQAFISVDEEGTEAAAATAAGVSPISIAQVLENKVFDARRPFLFAIRDTATKAVLFWGQVVNPNG